MKNQKNLIESSWKKKEKGWNGRMNKKGVIYNLIVGIFVMILGLAIGLMIIHAQNSEKYKTSEVFDCNDKNGNIIEGAICHKVISCSKIVKFLNQDGCEEFILEEE